MSKGLPMVSRRDVLLSTLFGAGYVGLRALASGIPAAALLAPRSALAFAPPRPAGQYVIMSTSSLGDPINANCPGTYDDPGIYHKPDDPQLAGAPLKMRGSTFTAAQAWGQLPQSVLDRACFFHMMTDTPIHPKEPQVLALMGATQNAEMFPSVLSARLAPVLRTIQAEPLCIGASSRSEALTFGGEIQPMLPARAIKATLANVPGPLTDLQALRDQTVDDLYALYKTDANKDGQAYLDRLALSQRQARLLEQSLLDELTSIKDDGPTSQVIAAIALIKMNVAPVITIHVPFGGDNHNDTGLAQEKAQTVSGIQTIQLLMQKLADAGLEDKVTFVSLNVFGRTLNQKSANGRQHNPNHQVSLAIGRGIAGGVIGGVAPVAGDYGATAIDSKTGRSAP
jgi:hypothetical protein